MCPTFKFVRAPCHCTNYRLQLIVPPPLMEASSWYECSDAWVMSGICDQFVFNFQSAEDHRYHIAVNFVARRHGLGRLAVCLKPNTTVRVSRYRYRPGQRWSSLGGTRPITNRDRTNTGSDWEQVSAVQVPSCNASFGITWYCIARCAGGFLCVLIRKNYRKC